MTDWVWIAFLVVAGVVGLVVRRELCCALDIAAFERRFPGKCIICSYWRYGRREGLTTANKPPHHDYCPERKGNA